MVIVRLNGGLGNQMFEYAMARTVAHRRRTSVRVDLLSLNADRKRCYALGAFKVQGKFASDIDLLSIRIAARLDRIFKPSKPYYAQRVVREQSICFDGDALRAPRHCLLIGYWPSERYFKEIADVIRQDFTLRDEPSVKTGDLSRAVRGTNSVFVHVRRGDYVHDSASNQAHGTCSLEYYQQAACYVARLVHQPHFFVFSDEPDWVRRNLNLPFAMTIVDHNPPGDARTPGREHEDLWLMAQCRHAILANSTFSWWAAWLNPERSRIVVRPKRWATDRRFEPEIPDDWIAL